MHGSTILAVHSSLPVAGFVWLLLLASVTTLVARKIRVPYTIALSQPASVPGRSLNWALAFGVVLFSTLVQGLTIEPLVRRLGLVARPAQVDTLPPGSSLPAASDV